MSAASWKLQLASVIALGGCSSWKCMFLVGLEILGWYVFVFCFPTSRSIQELMLLFTQKLFLVGLGRGSHRMPGIEPRLRLALCEASAFSTVLSF